MDSEFFGPVLIVGLSVLSFVYLIKIISDNKIRHKLIEKGMVDENSKYLYSRPSGSFVSSSLKWGFVLIGLGLAFIIGMLVPSDFEAEITIGSMFVFSGLGLILYYVIARKSMEKNQKK